MQPIKIILAIFMVMCVIPVSTAMFTHNKDAYILGSLYINGSQACTPDNGLCVGGSSNITGSDETFINTITNKLYFNESYFNSTILDPALLNYYIKNENINASGYNVTADYFIGNGSLLTDISSGDIDYTNIAMTNKSNDFGVYNLTTTGYFIGNGSLLTNLNWSHLSEFPLGCPADTYVTQIDGSITCTGITLAGSSGSILFNDGGVFGGFGKWNKTQYALAIGDGNIANSNYSLALGSYAKALNNKAISIGAASEVTGNSGVAIGDGNNVTGYTGMALGDHNYISSDYGIGLGSRVNATGNDQSIAIGLGIQNQLSYSILLGSLSNAIHIFENNITISQPIYTSKEITINDDVVGSVIFKIINQRHEDISGIPSIIFGGGYSDTQYGTMAGIMANKEKVWNSTASSRDSNLIFSVTKESVVVNAVTINSNKSMCINSTSCRLEGLDVNGNIIANEYYSGDGTVGYTGSCGSGTTNNEVRKYELY